MSDNYIIGRSKDCNVIANATDKPIELWMHHFHARSLIINLKTGDVLTYLFSDGSQSSAQTQFESSGACQIEHNIFLEQDGEKALFILKTNYNSPSVDRYIKIMTDQEVVFAGEIITDIKNDFPLFEKFRFGEISTGFIIDLNSPSIFKTRFSECTGKDQMQNAITTVGNEPSTLPDIEKQVQLYFQYRNIGKLISWADDRLAVRLEESGIDLSNMGDISEHIANAMTVTMKEERPFSHNHLYDEKYGNYIIDTLTLVKEKGLDDVVIASLCGNAATELARHIMDTENDEPEFFPLVSLAQKIFTFAVNLAIEQSDVKIKNNCHMQMQDQLARLQKVIFHKLKDFDHDKLPDNMTNLLQILNLPK